MKNDCPRLCLKLNGLNLASSQLVCTAVAFQRANNFCHLTLGSGVCFIPESRHKAALLLLPQSETVVAPAEILWDYSESGIHECLCLLFGDIAAGIFVFGKVTLLPFYCCLMVKICKRKLFVSEPDAAISAINS